jgi:membrane protein implicated in regulation of membrane protease activity
VTRRPRLLRWEQPAKLPAHPYRDSLSLYGALALLIVLFAWLTGGSVLRGVVIAVVFFAVASAWSAWRWRQRLAQSRDREGASQ